MLDRTPGIPPRQPLFLLEAINECVARSGTFFAVRPNDLHRVHADVRAMLPKGELDPFLTDRCCTRANDSEVLPCR